jgi:glucosylceramidase
MHDRTPEFGLIPFIKESQKYKADTKFWASPWTPPLWAKKDGSDNIRESGGYDKGVFDDTKSAEYAAFFVSWIDAYEKEGIPISFVVPQNEPGWAQAYPTCSFGPATDSGAPAATKEKGKSDPVTFGPFIKTLHDALQLTPYKTKVWFGTMSNNGSAENQVFDKYWASLTDKSIIGGACLQWATQPRIAAMKTAKLDVMASEHKCGNYPWLDGKATSYQDTKRDNFLAAEAPNNFAYGEESWDEIKSWINDGVNYYSAWNLVLDTYGWNLDETRPWPQNAMFVVKADKTYAVTPYYYVFRHVAQYVDLGAKVVTVTGDALAFKNPDGSVVVTVHNAGAAGDIVVSIDGTMYTVNVPAQGWATINKKP